MSNLLSISRFEKRLDFSGKEGRIITKYLTEIDSLNSKFVVKNDLSPQLVKKLIKSVLITSSGASTRIEGSVLEDKDVEKVFDKLNVQHFNTRDEQEVAGYLEILKIVWEEWNSINLDESTIKSIHSQLLKYSIKDNRHKGNYKTGSNRVEAKDIDGNLIGIVFEPTEPYLTPIEMKDLVDWTNQEFDKKDFHPLIIIGNFVLEYLAIHPFQDGNGRSSRVLTNLLLLKFGYMFAPYISHDRIIEKNKDEYYKVLNSAQRSRNQEFENLFFWMEFFLKVIKIQVQEAVIILNQKEDIEIQLSKKQMLVWEEISSNNNNLSISELHQITNISTSTLKQILLKLIKLNKIIKLGVGKSTRYRKN
jgi:Fic family protein